jgi:beta-lactamase regulating signal transducer with metallopeptidase domain
MKYIKNSIVLLWIVLATITIIMLLSRETDRDPQSESKLSVLETTIQDRHMTIKMRRATKEEIEQNRKAIENERTEQK